MLKDTLTNFLERNDICSAGALAARDRKGLSALIRLSYARDTLVGWRAILAVGLAAKEMVRTDAAFLRETCRKLLWSLTDESGGIGWSAPELLGEIVAADPRQFADIVPLIAEVYERDEEVFRPGVLYALARIAETAPGLAAVHQKAFVSALADREPQVRVRGVRLVAAVWPHVRDHAVWSIEFRERVRSALSALVADKGEAWIYEGSDFISVVVGEETNKTINLIS